MNVEIGAEAAQFPEKEYINGIAVAVQSGTTVWIWQLGPFQFFPLRPAICLYTAAQNTEGQQPNFSVHSIMMEIPAQAVEGGPPPFTISTITCKVQLIGPIHSLYFYSTPICTMCVRRKKGGGRGIWNNNNSKEQHSFVAIVGIGFSWPSRPWQLTPW